MRVCAGVASVATVTRISYVAPAAPPDTRNVTPLLIGTVTLFTVIADELRATLAIVNALVVTSAAVGVPVRTSPSSRYGWKSTAMLTTSLAVFVLICDAYCGTG